MWSRVSAMTLVLVVWLTATAGAQADRVEHAQRRVAAAPNDPALWVKLADALVRAQRIPEGVDAYQSAIKLDPGAAAPKLALARLQLQIGEPMRAAVLMRDVVATSTDDALVASTGNELVALEEMMGTLGELAHALLPSASSPARRRVLVAAYERQVVGLEARARGGDAAAAAELARIGTTALTPLVAALDDPDAGVQRGAIAVLGRTANLAAAPALVKLARRPVKQPAASPYEAMDERELRVAALVAAGRLASPAVFDAVLPLAESVEVATREAATFALGRTGDRRAVAPLIAALYDRRPSVATLACLGLARLRDPRVGPALFTVVGEARRDAVSRGGCAYAIGVQRLAAGVPALTRALEDSGEVGRLAAWSLGEIAQPATLAPLLAAYFAHAGRDRLELELAIARTTGTPAVRSAPIDLGDYPRTRDRYDAAQAIAALPGPLAALPISDGALRTHATDIAQAIAGALASPDSGAVLGVLGDLDSFAD